MIVVLAATGGDDIKHFERLFDEPVLVLDGRTGEPMSRQDSRDQGGNRRRWSRSAPSRAKPMGTDRRRAGQLPDALGRAARALLPRANSWWDQAKRDVQALGVSSEQAPGLPKQEERLVRVLGAVDETKADVLVASDRPSERLAWRVARRRPQLLVLSDAVLAASILASCGEQQGPRTPDAVREMLDSRKPPPVVGHDYPEIPVSKQRRSVTLSSSGADEAPHARAAAAAFARMGFDSIVLTEHDERGRDYFWCDGALVTRVTARRVLTQGLRTAPPRRGIGLLGYSSEAAMTRARAQRRLESLSEVDGAKQARAALGKSSRHAANRVKRYTTALRSQAFLANQSRAAIGISAVELADTDLSLGPKLDKLRPSVIYAPEAALREVAMRSAARREASGDSVPMVLSRQQVGGDSPSQPELDEASGRVATAVVTLWTPDGSSPSIAGRLNAELATAERGDAFRSSGADTHVPSLLIGPANYAGQGWMWARAIESDVISATACQVVSDDHPFRFPADVTMLRQDWARPGYRMRAFRDLAPRHTHALLEAGRPLFAADGGAVPDVDALRRSGLQVALIFHGSEIRHPTRHARREPFSPFRDRENDELTQGLLSKVSHLHAALAGYEGIAFVSTPDLLDDLPWATWLPVCVDVKMFAPKGRDPGESAVPVVLHSPSKDALKGSRAVDEVLSSLHRDGIIKYRRVRSVPHSSMPGLMQEADVVVDQLALGAIGVAAAEAMASGRVVVANVSERVRSRYPRDVPVVQATPADLDSVVRQLASDRAWRARLAEESRSFALQIHDGSLSASVLATSMNIGRR